MIETKRFVSLKELGAMLHMAEERLREIGQKHDALKAETAKFQEIANGDTGDIMAHFRYMVRRRAQEAAWREFCETAEEVADIEWKIERVNAGERIEA